MTFGDAVSACWLIRGSLIEAHKWPDNEDAVARVLVMLFAEADEINNELATAAVGDLVEDSDGAPYPAAIQLALRQQAAYLMEFCGFCGGSGIAYHNSESCSPSEPCPRCGFLYQEAGEDQ